MALDIRRYTYNPVYVKAVQVTSSNMKAVAKWCGGQVVQEDSPAEPYIKVETIRPMRLRQTQAFMGDWVVKTSAGYKVYLEKAFPKAFQPAPEAAVVSA